MRRQPGWGGRVSPIRATLFVLTAAVRDGPAGHLVCLPPVLVSAADGDGSVAAPIWVFGVLARA